jgi:hypothetical protein
VVAVAALITLAHASQLTLQAHTHTGSRVSRRPFVSLQAQCTKLQLCSSLTHMHRSVHYTTHLMCYNFAQQLTNLNNKNKNNSNKNTNKKKNGSKGTVVKPLVSSDGKLPLEASGGAKPLKVHGVPGCIDTVPLQVNPFTDNASEEGFR